jgi:hypothetical protein
MVWLWCLWEKSEVEWAPATWLNHSLTFSLGAVQSCGTGQLKHMQDMPRDSLKCLIFVKMPVKVPEICIWGGWSKLWIQSWRWLRSDRLVREKTWAYCVLKDVSRAAKRAEWGDRGRLRNRLNLMWPLNKEYDQGSSKGEGRGQRHSQWKGGD